MVCGTRLQCELKQIEHDVSRPCWQVLAVCFKLPGPTERFVPPVLMPGRGGTLLLRSFFMYPKWRSTQLKFEFSSK